MRKRYNLIFILILGLVLMFSLVACNQSATDPDKLPGHVGGDSTSVDRLPENASAGLKFTFPVEMSSVFNSIYVDEFKLGEYVHYSVVYYTADGAVLKEIPYGEVTDGMIAEDDKQYLTKAGHHTIHVKAVLDDNTTASGIFKLHLKDRGAISLAKYTFKLKDINGNDYAYPYFGTLNEDQTEVSVNLEKGVTIDSWEDFTRSFNLSLKGKALQYVKADKASTVYSATSDNFPMTVGADETFQLAFTDDVIKVTYHLNKPQFAELRESTPQNPIVNPETLFAADGKYGNETPQRGVGYVTQPLDSEMNVYHGYTFAGWFNKATNTLWRFTSTVGNDDLELEAHWVLTEYSFTVYTMGGVFKSGLSDATLNNSTADKDLIEVESTSRFSLSTGELNRITFTGFHYNVQYDKYIARVTVNSNGDTVLMRFKDIYKAEELDKLMTKSGDSLKIDELYTDYQCTDKVKRGAGNDRVNDDQPVTYVKWIFNDTDNDAEYLSRVSKYYTDVVFKDGYTILADGSVRLDQVKDWNVNELVVPAEITINGKNYRITEIGERALANAKAITKLDLSKATNLTTIGTEAFAHASYLKEIVMPSENAITNIGDNAFWDTSFEDKFAENNKGAEFIVIGSMIYKYVGKDCTDIDLSNPETYYSSDLHGSSDMTREEVTKYNKELAGVVSIEDGAFARCPSLVRLYLPKQITTIRNNALSGLSNFSELHIDGIKPEASTADEGDDGETTGGETTGGDNENNGGDTGATKTSLLLNIGESAFDGTPFLSTKGNLYDEKLNAIIIGNVYYRFLGTGNVTAEIPSKHKEYAITHIASQAFKDCALVEEVTFGNESQIQSIGANAFSSTAILKYNRDKNNTPYTIYNGILTDYYAPTINANEADLVIPDNVRIIAANAFGQYGRYFESVQIGDGVKVIENYAFSGANTLTKIILTKVSVEADSNIIQNAPLIGEYAFADANGEMRSGAKLYFDNKVIDKLKALDASDDDVTAAWLRLYKMRANYFEADAIESVIIDRDKVASIMMQITNGAPTKGNPLPFLDTYGDYIEDALIITRNTRVSSTENLSASANGIEFIYLDPEKIANGKEIWDPTGKYDYSSLWQKEWSADTPANKVAKRYVLYYTYPSAEDKCAVNPKTSNELLRRNIFIVTVYDAIDSVPQLNTVGSAYVSTKYGKTETDNKNANTCINKEEDNTLKYWFTGLNGQFVEGNLPSYYTSFTGFRNNNFSSVVFHYIDVNGQEKTIAPTVSGLITSAEGNRFTATLTVNFYGIGSYRFDYSYSVKKSRYNAIEQTKTINIPVNESASRYVRDNPLNLVGEDGNVTPVGITANVFSYIGAFNTTSLGQKSVTVRYSDIDAVETLEYTVYYTVVLEANESMLKIAVSNDRAKTARIIGFADDVSDAEKEGVTTLVLPSKVTINNIEYTVTEIGNGSDSADGVFEGLTNLTAVYLPETIEYIGVNTFSGCTNLRNIYTAIQTSATAVELNSKDYFTEVGKSYVENGWTVQPVTLKSLPTDLEIKDNELIIAGDYVMDQAAKLKYRVIEIDVRIINATANTDVYLPDTVYRKCVVTDNQVLPIEHLYFYSAKSDFMIKTANYVPEKLITVAKGSFRDCKSLESINFTHATELTDIGAYAFMGSGLKSIDLSNNKKVVEIHSALFEGCLALEKVTLHSGITYIDERAFKECKSLKSIDVEGGLENLKEIGASAFIHTDSLSRIDLYNKLTKVKKGAFANSPGLTIYCHFGQEQTEGWEDGWNENPSCPVVWNYTDGGDETADNGYIYYVAPSGLRYALKDGEATVSYQMFALSGDVVIPDKIEYKGKVYTVTSIRDGAFEGNTNITSVTVSSALKSIGAEAFSGCTSLVEFKFSGINGLKNINATAFTGSGITNPPQTSDVATEDEV